MCAYLAITIRYSHKKISVGQWLPQQILRLHLINFQFKITILILMSPFIIKQLNNYSFLKEKQKMRIVQLCQFHKNKIQFQRTHCKLWTTIAKNSIKDWTFQSKNKFKKLKREKQDQPSLINLYNESFILFLFTLFLFT